MNETSTRSAQTRERMYTPAQEVRVQSSGGKRTLSGYAAVFGQPSQDLGGYTEVVSPGAFTGSLTDSPDILCLRDHDASILLGRTKSNTLTLTQDERGLRFVCALPNTTQANDLAESIERGDLDGVSFGFVCPEGGDKWTSPKPGQLVRTLLKVNLYEISPCSFPAYPSASVALRSCPPELRSMLARVQTDTPHGANLPVDDTSSDLNRMHMRLALAQRR